MIKLLFSLNRDLMQYLILNKELFYKDKVFTSWIRICPPDYDLINKLEEQDKKNKYIPKQLKIPSIAEKLKLTEEEIKEFNDCKTEEEIKEKVIRDARANGCLLISEIKENK